MFFGLVKKAALAVLPRQASGAKLAAGGPTLPPRYIGFASSIDPPIKQDPISNFCRANF